MGAPFGIPRKKIFVCVVEIGGDWNHTSIMLKGYSCLCAHYGGDLWEEVHVRVGIQLGFLTIKASALISHFTNIFFLGDPKWNSFLLLFPSSRHLLKCLVLQGSIDGWNGVVAASNTCLA